MPARIGIVTFPGSLDDADAARAVGLAGGEPVRLWHADADLRGVAAVILPGGFSYGDYLRAGAIARFSPVLEALLAGAADGLPVLGICNGFQVLCEAHLLPGALAGNASGRFLCRDARLRVTSTQTAWTRSYPLDAELVIPIKHHQGRYVAAEADLDALEANGQVVLRYVGENPNGSLRGIAGVSNAAGTVVGLMPHPEHALERLTGPSTDGLGFFTGVVADLVAHA